MDNFYRIDAAQVIANLTKSHALYEDWICCIWDTIRDCIPELVEVRRNSLIREEDKRIEALLKAKEKYRDKQELRTGLRKHLPVPDGVYGC